jgi:hypothetical protein
MTEPDPGRFTARRHKIATELLEALPMPKIIAAAAHLMTQKTGGTGEFTRAEIAEWIESLDADGLLHLRKVAENFEGGTVQ